MQQLFYRLSTTALLALMGAASLTPMATALQVPITQINFAGSGSLPLTTATFTVPDRNTTISAGQGLRRYDAHVAKMIELTQFWCQGRQPDFTVEWNYEADGGKVFMGQYPMTCRFAGNVFQTIGNGPRERVIISYRGNPRSETIQALDLKAAKAKKFRNLVQTIKPQCIENLNICPGDSLE
jgi:hypothetical protein